MRNTGLHDLERIGFELNFWNSPEIQARDFETLYITVTVLYFHKRNMNLCFNF